VVNAEKIHVTGNKRADKRYYRHSGYPGGLRSRSFEEMQRRRPEQIIRLAVKGMMPRNRLARKQLTKLKVYAGAEQQAPQADAGPEPEAAEQPEPHAEAAQEDAALADGTGAEQPLASEPPAEAQPVADAEPAPPQAQEDTSTSAPEDEHSAEAPEPARTKPSVPGAHLEVDIVPEGVDPLGRGEEQYEDRYAIEEEDLTPVAVEESDEEPEEALTQPIASAAIDLAAGARYRATGKRKTAIARVTLRPGTGSYVVNGRTLEEHFPRATLQRNIRQPLETVGYQERMDVVARLHGGGISAQAGALRHGVSRALLEADPNLRGELKRRGFLTRDSRAKERKKAGLKKARKRPQFSKR
jgi:small subunit ribosomal protein S9